MTTVISIRKVPPGWRSDPKYVYIGRAGKGADGPFGNPHPMVPGQTTRKESISAFRAYFMDRLSTDDEFRGQVHQLRGKTLVCFCKPLECHGDVIADYLNDTEKTVWE